MLEIPAELSARLRSAAGLIFVKSTHMHTHCYISTVCDRSSISVHQGGSMHQGSQKLPLHR